MKRDGLDLEASSDLSIRDRLLSCGKRAEREEAHLEHASILVQRKLLEHCLVLAVELVECLCFHLVSLVYTRHTPPPIQRRSRTDETIHRYKTQRWMEI
jgi:hypothetical protein